MDLSGVSDGLKVVILIGGAGAVVLAFVKWVLPRWRHAKHIVIAGSHTLVGREAVVDSITGEEISPAILGVGARMANQEQQLAMLTGAVSELAIASRRLDDLETRVTAIEQGHHLERMAGAVESIQLLKTIEQVAQTERDDRPDDN